MWVEGGAVVLVDRVVEADVHVSNGRIVGLCAPGSRPDVSRSAGVRRVDARGLVVMPGLIDLHCDAMEKEWAPRLGTSFPFRTAFNAVERRCAAWGVTTVYHALALSGETGIRQNETVDRIIGEMRAATVGRTMIRHRIHLRHEWINVPGIDLVLRHIGEGNIDLLSFMDHSPDQGQFKKEGQFERYLLKTFGVSGEEARVIKERQRRARRDLDRSRLQEIAREAVRWGIPLASHDDDERERIGWMAENGASISEFPIHLRAAAFAVDRGMSVCLGAPNVVRGGSHNGNLRARDGIAAGVVDLLCSDYHVPSLLEAVFLLANDGLGLPEAVRLATLGPAKAVGLDGEWGSIEVGKRADLILVEPAGNHPVVRRTIVGGSVVYRADYA
ncbi:amidohydrolase [Kyrpidia tusciae DSM 2912]|uniref:Amidohydrolase n=1 Tax=Kyrpidia tusciae (strain DSM 2912 / NBRC 15312 / T2) TaxID=562970 RepID=D5WWE4_KYRT2|nr:amidohydrolase [Kyrpidia tusciae DSM 2912]